MPPSLSLFLHDDGGDPPHPPTYKAVTFFPFVTPKYESGQAPRFGMELENSSVEWRGGWMDQPFSGREEASCLLIDSSISPLGIDE